MSVVLLKPCSSKTLKRILSRLENLMATQSELATQMATVTAVVQKVGTESAATLALVTALQKQIANLLANGGNVTPELQAAVDALAAQIKVVDDLVPDVAP